MEEIDNADEIARHRFEKRDLATGVLDDADLEDLLAWRLAVPPCFKEREIAPVHHKMDEDEPGNEPFFAGVRELSRAGFGGGGND